MREKEKQEEYSDEEIARRRDAVIKRMANTPPKPHSATKIGKRKAKVKHGSSKPSPRRASQERADEPSDEP